ncbi:hypothetical protein NFI96_023825, partial [Prochilodus magdalenae]
RWAFSATVCNASSCGDEEDEIDNEIFCTTRLFGADFQENEENLSDSEGSMLDATRSEAGNDVGTEDLMEGNTGGENASEYVVNGSVAWLVKPILVTHPCILVHLFPKEKVYCYGII